MATGKPRGLAALSREKRREIARKGGKAVQRMGRGHRWASEEAKRMRESQLSRREELYEQEELEEERRLLGTLWGDEEE